MKPFLAHIHRTAGLVVAIAIWAGCSAIMSTQDVPVLQTASLLNSPRSQSFILHPFGDEPNMTSPVILQVGFNKLTLEESPATMAANAVRRELERTGHRPIQDGQQSKGDFLIEGIVTECALRRDIVQSLTTITGSIEMTITVRPATGGKTVFRKQYRGYHFANGRDLQPKIWKEVLGQAIASSVKKLSTDRDLAAFIHTL